MERLSAKAPARINMLGNPADGNEGDHATISAAIGLPAAVEAQPAERFTIQLPDEEARVFQGEPPFELDGPGRLAAAAVNRLWRDSAAFRAAWSARPPSLRFRTEIPPSSGLGGSSVLVLLALAALRAWYGLDRAQLHDYRLAELAQQTEELELGITCGFADRYVPLFGGLAYVDYRGKLWHRGPDEEPFATYERLDPWVADFPVVVAYTGVLGDSGDVHRVLRGRYLEERRAWSGSGTAPFLVRTMAAVGETAWRGKAALLAGDWARVGELMNENHRLVDEMMRACGFDGGAGAAVNRLVGAALDGGAFGAKLTGAGGRGSIFVVTAPGREQAVAGVLEEAARRERLDGARVFPAALDRDGLVMEES